MAVDGRGSILQRQVYEWLIELYPNQEVVYEHPIGELGMRIDLFLPLIGLAIEIQGRQHREFTSFFHKDEIAWNQGKLYDKKKKEYLLSKGCTFVEIHDNIKISSAQELKEYIDNNSVFEEDVIYDVGIGIQTKSNRQLLVEKKQREYKEGMKKKQRESQFHKDYVEKQKQLRKQKYKEYKEKMKNK